MTTKIHRSLLPALPADLVARWRAVPTTITADLSLGRTLADPRIRPLTRLAPGPSLAGRVVTARCDPPDFGAVLHAVDLAEAGDVVLIAAGGNRDTAMIGELLSGSARLKGVSGVVCDGAVRDIGMLAQWTDFPVFTLANIARGPASKHGGDVNGPVVFGGLAVNPGDLLVGDDDGIVILSPAQAAELIEAAEAKCRAEVGWEARLSKGAKLVEVFEVPTAVQLERA